MANKSGTGQTESGSDKLSGMWCYRTWVFPSLLNQNSLERDAIEGDSPLDQNKKGNAKYPEYCSLNIEQKFG